MKKRSKFMTVFLMVFVIITGCNKKPDTTTPKGITEAFLTSMQAGEYKEASTYAGIEFDEKTYEKSAALQKKLMKKTYANMSFNVKEEQIKENKATVEVVVENCNYIDLLNDAIYKTMKNEKDDVYTEKQYIEAMDKAKKQKFTVLVNYHKEKKKWIFDGSNSQLYAAMLGYLNN